MSLDESQIKLIVSKGVKKAKSLVALHMSGNEMNIETLLYIREILNINFEDNKRENTAIAGCHEVCAK
jgi:adenine-specific DNA methylase